MKNRIYTRLLAAFLTVLLSASHTCFAAATSDTGNSCKEKEILTMAEKVKERISLPKDYSIFEYNAIEATKMIGNRYEFNWNNAAYQKGLAGGGYIYVQTDEQGNVLLYTKTAGQVKLGAETNAEKAEANAEIFINKLNPGMWGQFRLKEDNESQPEDNVLCFEYYQVINGLPFYDRYVRAVVDKNSGEVISYTQMGDWSDIDFPKPEGLISLERAEKEFKSRIGLKLIYDYIVFGDKYEAFPVYSVVDTNYVINGSDGSKVLAIHPLSNELYVDYTAAKKKYFMSGSPVIIHGRNPFPDNSRKPETKIGLDDAEKIARNTKAAQLTEGYKLAESYVSDELDWNLRFEKEGKENYYFVINSMTGDIKAFFTDINYYDNARDIGKYTESVGIQSPEIEAEPSFDENSVKQSVDEELNLLHGLKSGELEYTGCTKYFEGIPDSSSITCDYSFRYMRKANGILFPANYVEFVYSPAYRKIVSFKKVWFDVDFEPVGSIKQVDSMYDILFNKVGLELKYVTTFNTVKEYKKEFEKKYKKPEATPAFGLKPGKPLLFDAETGIMLDYNGEPFGTNNSQ